MSTDDGDTDPYLGTRAGNPRANAQPNPLQNVLNSTSLGSAPSSRVDLGMLGRFDQPTVWEAVHYPHEGEFQFDSFYLRYIRQAEAQAVIDKPVNDTWQETPTIHDEAHTDTDEPQSAFEQKVEEFLEGEHTRRKPIHRLRTLDKLARLGHYAVMVIGFADGRELKTPIGGVSDDSLSEEERAELEAEPGVNVPDNFREPEFQEERLDGLMYLAVFAEDRIVDLDTNSDMTSPRFRLPEFFDIITQEVEEAEHDSDFDSDKIHWTRAIHVPEGTLEDDLEGTPALKPVFHELLNIDKIKAASGEGFWRAGYQGLHVQPPRDARGEPMEFDDPEAVHDEISEFLNNFDRELATPAEINSIESNVGNPMPHLEANYQSISAATDIPKSILTGEDRADTANSQDIRQWHQKIGQRRNSYAEPVILKPLIQRLIDSGILPEPEGEGFTVEWPALDEMSEQEMWEMRNTIAKTIDLLSPGGNSSQFAEVSELRQAIGWGPQMGSEVEQDTTEGPATPAEQQEGEEMEVDEQQLPDISKQDLEYPEELYDTPRAAEERAVELGLAEDYHVVEAAEGVFYRPGPDNPSFIEAMEMRAEESDGGIMNRITGD